MLKYLLSSVISALALLSAIPSHASEIYGDVGTEGLGLGYAVPIGSHDNLRVEINGMKFHHDFSAGGLDYSGTAKLFHAGIYGDYFPAPSFIPFHLTAGLIIGGDVLDLDTTVSQTVINPRTRSAIKLQENVTGRAKLPDVRPYLGFGFGHTPQGKKGLSAFFDAGVAYGTPRIEYDAPATLVQAVGQGKIASEEQQLQTKVNKLRFYPIVKVGITYRF